MHVFFFSFFLYSVNTSQPDWVLKIMDKLEHLQSSNEMLLEKVDEQSYMIDDLINYSRDLGTLYDKLDSTVYLTIKRTERNIRKFVSDLSKPPSATVVTDHAVPVVPTEKSVDAATEGVATEDVVTDSLVNEEVGITDEEV